MQDQISSDDTAMNIPIVTLTAAAAEQAKKLMGRAEDGVIGLRVGIKTAGCSGLQYQVEYATEQKPFEDRIVDKGVVILIDPAAVMFLIGSEMDWKKINFRLLLLLATQTKQHAVDVVKALLFPDGNP